MTIPRMTKGDSVDELKGYIQMVIPKIAAAADIWVNPKDPKFGAKGDGTTDDRAAVQAAIDSISAGVVIIPPNTTFLLSSFSSSYYTLKPKSNVSIVGFGPTSTLKIANSKRSETQGITILYDHANYFENCVFANFTVDFNGANNLDLWHNVNSSVNRMGGNGGMKNVKFLYLNFKNAAGSHFLWLSNQGASSNAREQVQILGCRFDTCGKAIASNLVNDHSSIYCDLDRVVISNNIFSQPNTTDTVSTAIETHGSDIVAQGNTIYGYNIGFNVAAQLQNATHIKINNNTAREVVEFARLWSGGAYVLSHVDISNNIGGVRDETSTNAFGVATYTTTMASSANGNHLTIDNNEFYMTAISDNSLTGKGIMIYRFDDVRITNNTIYNFPAEGIYLEAETSTARSLSRIKVSNNKLVNVGIGSTTANKRGIGCISYTTSAGKDISELEISNNQIICGAGGGTIADYGIQLNSTGEYPNSLIHNNKIVGYDEEAVDVPTDVKVMSFDIDTSSLEFSNINVGVGVTDPVDSIATSGTLSVRGPENDGMGSLPNDTKGNQLKLAAGWATNHAGRILFGTTGATGWRFHIARLDTSGGTPDDDDDILTVTDQGFVGIMQNNPVSVLQVVGIPVYADNAAAVTGGLGVGSFYRTGADPDTLCIVHA